MSKPKTFPEMDPGSFAMVSAETATGILLNLDGKRAIGEDVRYRVYTDLAEAIAEAKRVVGVHKDRDCIILDHEAKPVEMIRPGTATPAR